MNSFEPSFILTLPYFWKHDARVVHYDKFVTFDTSFVRMNLCLPLLIYNEKFILN